MSVLTRIKNNQITDATIWANAKIIAGSIVGSLFSPTLTMTSDVTITGNLTVQGASTYLTVASTNTFVNDPLIVLNNAFTGSNTYDLGFIFNRGSDANKAFYWDESSDEFRLITTTETGTTYGSIAAETNFEKLRLGNLVAQYDVSTITLTATGFINTTANVSAAIVNTGALNATGTTTLAAVNSSGFIQTTGNISGAVVNAGALNATGTTTLVNVNSSGFIQTTGNISGAVVNAGALNATGTTTLVNVNATGLINTTSNISAAVVNGGAINSTGLINTTANISGAVVNAGALNATGTTTLAAVNSSGFIQTTGNISGAVVNAGALNATGTVTLTGFLNSSANISAAVLNGGAINSTGLINTSGNVSAAVVNAGQFNTTGNLSATQVSTQTLKASGLTSGRVVFTSTGGLLVDNAGITFTANTLTVGGAKPVAVDGTAGSIGTTLANLVLNTNYYVDLNSKPISNLLDPTSLQDAATKNYVDSQLSGYAADQIIVGDTEVTITDTGTDGTITEKADGITTSITTSNLIDLKRDTKVSNTTASTSTTTGAFQVVGGVGIGGNITVGGNIKGTDVTQSTSTTTGAIITAGGLGVAKNLTVGGDATITGNLTVQGRLTAIQSTTLDVTDLQVTLAKGAGTSAAADGAGINVDYGNVGANITYTHATLSWNFNKPVIGSSYANFGGNVLATNFVGGAVNVSGNVLAAQVSTGTLNATGLINTLGNISAAVINTGALNSTGFINTTGNVSAAIVNAGALNATGTTTLVAVNSTGFINTTANVSASAVNSATLNVTGTSTLAAVNSSGFINTTANVSAAVVNTGALNATGTTTLAAVNSSGFIQTTGNISGAIINGGAINSTGLINTTANISAAVVNTAILNATGLTTTAGVNSSANVLATGGIFSSLTVNGGITSTGYFNTSANISAAVISGGTIATTGNLSAGALNVTGNILGSFCIFNSVTVNGTSSATTFSGAGTSLTGTASSLSIGGSAPAGSLTGSTLNSGVTASSLQSVGTLSALTVGGVVSITDTTDTTSLASGALKVTGGTAVGKTLWVGEGAVINSTRAAEAFQVYGATGNNGLIYADTAKNAIVFSNTGNTTVQDGVIVKFDSVGAIRIPVGSSAQRPGTAGNVDVAGLLRFSSTTNNLEFYDGSAWTSAGSVFTIVTTNSFSGNGVQTAFTLSSSSTTAATMVAVNGVIQIPTTAYSITGTTLTFTEAPAAGDAIDARVFITTSTVSAISSANGYNAFDVATAPYANITAGTSSPTVRVSVDGATGKVTFTNDVVINGALTVLGDSAGNINIGDATTDKVNLQGTIVYDQTALTAQGTNLKLLDSFSTNSYHTAKYLFQIRDGANIESGEVLLGQDGVNVSITTYAVIAPAGVLGTFQSNISSGVVRWFYTPGVSTYANIKVQTTYIV